MHNNDLKQTEIKTANFKLKPNEKKTILLRIFFDSLTDAQTGVTKIKDLKNNNILRYHGVRI